ncbi:uncharacterized protein LOC133312919 [Gastrolobium bilobum]|uniref:uncharacterized protein LOC133312919 n=1 Tax=Gastrolobium bilobum TaxID=150636 RepID=UPI002AAF9D0A|nr:uncharacterized protein LOC133312919 [Gastrolobium bilobum]
MSESFVRIVLMLSLLAVLVAICDAGLLPHNVHEVAGLLPHKVREVVINNLPDNELLILHCMERKGGDLGVKVLRPLETFEFTFRPHILRTTEYYCSFQWKGSPYYLHPSENPALVLVSTLLNGKNYHGWATAMKMSLISKNKFSFVDGTISVPEISDPRFAAWERCNTMVDVFRISDLQDEIYKLQQGDNSVSDYYTKLKILWDELEALQPTPACRCIRPCCTISSQIREIRDRDYSIRFLKGLNEKFTHVRVFYNSADQAFERGRGTIRGRGRGYSSGRGRIGGSRLCTYCGKTNHTVDTCFEKHGYPPGFRQRNLTHKANVATVADHDQESEMQSLVNPTVAGNDKFTKCQYQTILDMIQQQMQQPNSTTHMSNMVRTKVYNMNTEPTAPAGNSIIPWILDTGTTDHITCCYESLCHVKKIDHVPISLPNGSIIYSHCSRTALLSDALSLENVLFVERFTVNLISVNKLIYEVNCRVLFQHRICIIQQTPSMKMIGSAKLERGLYVLKQNCKCEDSSSNNKDNLKTKREAEFSKTSYLVENCSAFDIMHIDIWGPCSMPSIHGYRYLLTIVDDNTRFTWGILMKAKSEVRHHIQSFVSLIENQFRITIKAFRSDNGPEFFMTDYFDRKGILHQTSCVESPEQNRVVERKHQHIQA